MTMSNDLTKKTTGTGLSTESGRFRQDLINQLTPEQRKELALKAGHEQLDLDKSDAEAVRRFNASSVEMQRDVQTAKDLNAIGSDFTMENSYKTASGETRIKVTKNNNTVWIVAMVVIAVIFFVLFSR
jgi:hypothetical protein